MNQSSSDQSSSGNQNQSSTTPIPTTKTQPFPESKTHSKRGKYLIEIERNKCISVGNCVAIAEDIFALDDEQIAVMTDPKTPIVSDDETILMAARSCPTQAIIIKDAETGEQIFP